MAEVTETALPGVGVRYDFTTAEGERVAVLFHRSGRREILVYDRADPDACRTVVRLSPDDTRTLGELLGASQVTEALAAVQQQVEGLAIDWVTVPAGSRFAGSTVGQGGFRTRTGVSIVAVIRGSITLPAPGPDQVLEGGDVAVVVGTAQGLEQFRQLLVE